MVGTMRNLVNEVLQAAVGNHFRDKLQSMPAVEFIETRQQVQEAALGHIRSQLTQYEVETRGVYIQDVVFPPKDSVVVLTQREIANQEKATFEKQQQAQRLRIDMEKTKGTADMQAQLARRRSECRSRPTRPKRAKNEGKGEAAFVELTGRAEATKVQAIGLAEAKATEALGLARAVGFEAQKEALGGGATALVAVANAVAEGHITVVPEVLVTGGSAGGGGPLDGLAATLMRYLSNGGSTSNGGAGSAAGTAGTAGTAGDPPAAIGVGERPPGASADATPVPPADLDEPPVKE